VGFPRFIAVTWLVLVCALAPACAEKRVALVIGNGAYAHADKLANPVNDARGMRDALAGLKFDVIYGEDLDLKTLRRMIDRFNSRIDGADVALVYFAGHGATFGDAPYVVPVDAEFSSLDEMHSELVAVEELIGDLRRAKTVRIAILDACRDNRAEQALKQSRGGPSSRGLAPPKNPAGLIIAYATQHGATAADSGTGANSPFTAALLVNIAAPGLDVTDMFRKVGRDVIAATGGRQRPEISISIYEQYALAPGAAKPGETMPGGASGAAVSEAALVWETVKSSPDIAAVDAFLRRYGNVPVYGDLARTRREQLAVVVTPPIPTPAQQPSSGVAPLTAAQERALKRGNVFKECADCPEMVVVPAGSFTMGSPADEPGRTSDSGPQHIVTIGKAFAVGKLHVTRDQFAVFAGETRYTAHSECSWSKPDIAQEGTHPAVCIDWDDANAYAAWLSKKTGKPYRLLSEAEWEYAARGRTQPGVYPRFWFGDDEKELCKYGNGSPCDVKGTSPAGKYKPNAFGLYDMFGNALQWTADCYHSSYNGAPADGSAWTTACGNSERVIRGGSWLSMPLGGFVNAGGRSSSSSRDSSKGFRVARTFAP
jgi:formylglycine-generating enzyme required for sulfatase activity